MLAAEPLAHVLHDKYADGRCQACLCRVTHVQSGGGGNSKAGAGAEQPEAEEEEEGISAPALNCPVRI